MDLFTQTTLSEKGIPRAGVSAPLAVRMRPRSLEQLVGQEHLLKPGSPLRRLIEGRGSGQTSVILWGPPGSGKTTLAYLIAQGQKRNFVEVSAVSAGVKELRAVIEGAKRALVSGVETVLFVDEVHRFSKSQQDALLPAVENGWVVLVAATTENPSFSVISPLLSRSLLLTLKGIEPEDLVKLLKQALASEVGLNREYNITQSALDDIVRLAGADGRKALTILEAAAAFALDASESGIDEKPLITSQIVHETIDLAMQNYDRDGDGHYDVTSAFIKSMRGSDPDAALHYLARMIVGGEDPRFIARRIIICAAEDVGMADPSVLSTAVAASVGVEKIGMPEGRILLAEAVVAVATAPKSNRSYLAIDAAIRDVKAGNVGAVPLHLRDAHYKGAKDIGHGAEYQYAHDCEHAVARQEYLPENLRGKRYYQPTNRGFEAELTTRLSKLRKILGR